MGNLSRLYIINSQNIMSKVRTKVATNSNASRGGTPNVPTTPTQLPFERMNYILLGVCALVIAFGFFLMSTDTFIDASQFSLSLHVAPVIVVAGFIGVIFAIMYTPKSDKSSDSETVSV
ncbi:MAG: DUF3098 domain-containing protein [Bacteroidia bacterium]